MEMKITSDNFKKEVLECDKRILLDFWASWCMPCMRLTPVIEEIGNEEDSFKVGKINVDDEPELAARFGIDSIPTLIVMDGGKVLKKAVGGRDKDEIIKMVKEA